MIAIGGKFIVFVGLIISLDVGIKLFSGVRVEIINRDSIAMQHVSVEVTGASYQIGDIPSGSSKSIKVKPHGESGVTIKYSNNTGGKHRIYIDTYIENGYSGYIKMQINVGKILHVEQDFKTLAFF